ncbi:MAG TPA: NADH-ubiquinone oxidoreductase-F iron-sulfur binding region domain-containing protein [Pirellulales bacterium]|jgi:NADH:ubiquinone oxidoreductase subunit F (NADH-binding)/NADH:ubiquinone oxidoreductase subunit E|nr:NADH-ubiquinone oxidoreductase-F iron-sulfur binding region domain-containing protein [Pirellulales bacterium]
MIFEELRRIQNHPANGGYLPESELRSLSRRTGTPLYRLQEVASFFPHFRLEKPPTADVKVCRDMACHLHGANEILQKLRLFAGEFEPRQLAVDGVSCLGRCDRGPIACTNHHFYSQDSLGELEGMIRETIAGQAPTHDRDPPLPFTDPREWKIDPYPAAPDYRAVREFIANPDPCRVLKELETAELLGMGGAGAPAARKWSDVWQATSPDGEKYVVCNGDESEPGTFKDREILLHKPYLVVEGVILAGLVLGATRGYIFIRHEYHEQIEAVRRAVADAEEQGACGPQIFGQNRSFGLEVVESPGGYICGEQGALIETLEEKRAQPRNRPPQLETNGLWNKPTLLSNVETFAWAVPIAIHGGAWYAEQGLNGCKGLRFFSISGDVKRPGAYEVPIGLTLGELVNMLAGGTTDGRPLLAIAPSGPSGGFLPAKLPLEGKRLPDILKAKLPPGATHLDILDLPLDLALFRQLGLMLGAGIVIYGQGRDMLDQALNCTEFFRNESCGKCVPCRIGSEKLVGIASGFAGARGRDSEFDAAREIVRELAQAMEMTSICGLGVAAPNPLISWMRYFRAEPAPHSAKTEGGRKSKPAEGNR